MSVGQLKAAFRRAARTKVVLLGQTGRVGAVQATAKVTYGPIKILEVLWIRKPIRETGLTDAGDVQRYANVIQVLPEDLGDTELNASMRIVRGTHAMTSHQAAEEWKIDAFAPVSEYKSFKVLSIDVSIPKAGGVKAP